VLLSGVIGGIERYVLRWRT